jgi:two-component system phosphate regulon sensor histidine kinase PhoR
MSAPATDLARTGVTASLYRLVLRTQATRGRLTFQGLPDASSWRPVAGQWGGDGGGVDTLPLWNPVTRDLVYRTQNTSGPPQDWPFEIGGLAGPLPFAGDWGFSVSIGLMRSPGRRTIALASTPLSSSTADDDVVGVVVVARDTTAASRLDEMRRDFVANVSHELKTPLSAIRAYAETLRDGALEDKPAAERFVDRMIEQSRRLQALLDDLLTLSRLENLEERPQPEPVDLMPILRRAVEVVEEPARARDVEVLLQEAVAPPPPVWGDRESLERLATNLLDNAVKYNREGGRVAVTVEVGPPELVLEVADTGIGIPEESVPRLFERFYRVDKGRARDEGGTGLGLAIVKHVAQSGGGRVEVESELGVGTVFRVHLPLAPPAPSD